MGDGGLVGIALALVVVCAPFVIVLAGTSGRFWSAVRRNPSRALPYLEGDDAWIVLPEGSPGATSPDEDLDGPYLLELPDGTDRVVYGRKKRMRASMVRYLRRLP